NIDRLGIGGALEILDLLDATDGEALTVSEWCTQHIDSLSGVQKDTLDRYRRYVKHDLGKLAEVPVTELTEVMVSGWVNAMEKAGAAGGTIANKHGFLAAALKGAVAQKLIPSSPCEHTRLPRTVRQDMVFLTHDEYARFLDYFTPHWQPLVTFLFSTGLRWGEATALRVQDVDLEHSCASLVWAWTRGNVLGPPKSRKSRRTVALAPEVVELLGDQVDGRAPGDLLFTNQRGGPVRGATFHDNAWQPAVRLANGEPAAKGKRVARRRDTQGKVIQPAEVPLGKRPRIHDARHTCASWLLASGVPINYVQAHLGHESITTTVDRYGHVMPAARQAISGAMSAALSQAHPQLEG